MRGTKLATLCYILRDGEVLLIRKKRGFGANKYNGVGGKVEGGEGVLEAAIREIHKVLGKDALEEFSHHIEILAKKLIEEVRE